MVLRYRRSQRERQLEIERLVEILIRLLPRFAVRLRLGLDQVLDLRQLVVGADDASFPIKIGRGDRLPERMTLEQLPHLGDLAQVLIGDRQDCEALLAFGDHQPVGEASRDRVSRSVLTLTS